MPSYLFRQLDPAVAALRAALGGGDSSKAAVGNTPLCSTPQGAETLPPSVSQDLQVGLDWLQGTFPLGAWGVLVPYFEKVFSDIISPRCAADGSPLGDRFYASTFSSVCGIYLAKDFRIEGKANHGFLSLPGGVLALLDVGDLLALLSTLAEHGFSPSRVDIRLDDFKKRVTPELARHHADRKNVFGFRYDAKSGRNYKYVAGKDGGDTIYFGSRGKNGSGKFLRIYDKFIESQGAIDAIRLELELSQAKAKEFWDLLVSSLDSADIVASLLVGAINACILFAKKSPSGRKDRAVPFQWWLEIVDSSITPSWASKRQVFTFDKAINWLEKQVSATFAMVLEGFASLDGTDGALNYFYSLWDKGEARFKTDEVKQNIVAQYLKAMGRGRAAPVVSAPELPSSEVLNDDFLQGVIDFLAGGGVRYRQSVLDLSL